MLFQAVIWMNLALIFYTWAVFSGRKQGLHKKHLIIFGIGLLCDYLGTHQMNLFAQAFGKAPEWHNITGIAFNNWYKSYLQSILNTKVDSVTVAFTDYIFDGQHLIPKHN